MDKALIGKRVRRHRESLSLTREQFAEQIKISPQFLAEIENGKKGMSAETLYKICAFSNASADYLIMGKQLTDTAKVPAGELLCKIPPQYTGVLEDMLKSFLQIIEISES